MGIAGDPPAVRQPGSEANHSPSSSAEVKSYIFTPLYVYMTQCLIKHTDNSTFFIFFMPLPKYQMVPQYFVF
jgi:hypothetical protein